MQRIIHWVVSFVGLVFISRNAIAEPTVSPVNGQKPNIIFILTDDLGYGDLGSFFQNQRKADGSPAHATPNLDALAAGGTRLAHHYCPAPVCAPSRASLLLGVHQGHANVRDNQFDKALEDNHTLASVMKQAGYATAAIGKWGLQGKPTTKEPDWPAHPLKRGFDYYYGYIRHADGHEHYPKEGLYRGVKEVWENQTEVSAGLDKCYTADLWAARAKKWIVDQRQQHAEQPFFMYLAFDTPHATCELPTQAYPPGRGLKGGLQWLAEPGHMINTASGKIDSFIHPDYAGTNWPNVYKRYATSVRRIDDAVGDLVLLLKDLKIDQQTMIVFTSDNGPSVESYLPEKITPVFFGSFGPFDGIKRDCWEGGLRVPTIVNWPGHVAKNDSATVPSSFPDWMATFAEVAGLPPPARCDGTSLLPTLTGIGDQRPPRVYVEYFEGGKTPSFDVFEPSHRDRARKQMQALVIGPYVGVRYNIKSATDPFEIYDAFKDPKEKLDLGKLPENAQLQQQFKDVALQVRRPGGAATRPYDEALVPAIAPDPNAKAGLRRQIFDGPFPWVPQIRSLSSAKTQEVAAADVSLTPVGGAAVFKGYLLAPTDGKYTFLLSTEGGAELRLHDATVIDADFGYQAGSEVAGEINLKAGTHPFSLTYHHRVAAKKTPNLKLEWTGPKVERQAIPGSDFVH